MRRNHIVDKTKRYSTMSVQKSTSTESVPAIPLEPQVVPNIFDLKYTPTVLMRYPKANYSIDTPFPAYAAMVRQTSLRFFFFLLLLLFF